MQENEIYEIKKEIRDLSNRLYYCSNFPSGRRTRREIESMIKKLGKKLEKEGIKNW